MHQQLLRGFKQIGATIVAPIFIGLGIATMLSACTTMSPSVDAHSISTRISALQPAEWDAFAQDTYQNYLATYCNAGSAITIESADQVFRALNSLSFYSPTDEMLACSRKMFGRLQQAGAITQWHRNALADAMIQARQFIEARDFAQKNAVVIDLPPRIFTRETPNSIWQLSADGSSLSQVEPHVAETYIVGIVHPNCGFSRKALQYVAHDGSLRSDFSKHAILLLPADRQLAIDAVKAWNAENVDLQMAYINKQSDWGFVQEWETPQFFLVHRGKVMRHVVGWIPSQTPQQLSSLLSGMHALLDKKDRSGGR